MQQFMLILARSARHLHQTKREDNYVTLKNDHEFDAEEEASARNLRHRAPGPGSR
jgi:hypothetical protein